MLVKILLSDGSVIVCTDVKDARRAQRKRAKYHKYSRRYNHGAESYPVLTVIRYDSGAVHVRPGKGRERKVMTHGAAVNFESWIVWERENRKDGDV